MSITSSPGSSQRILCARSGRSTRSPSSGPIVIPSIRLPPRSWLARSLGWACPGGECVQQAVDDVAGERIVDHLAHPRRLVIALARIELRIEPGAAGDLGDVAELGD